MSGISVIIPLYNREKYIAEAIQSVLNQNFHGPLEIIVSDDGSTDTGVDIALSFGFPVRVLIKPQLCLDQGVSATRNRGIMAASYEFIMFLDSDDYYLPNHLIKMLSILTNNQSLGFVFSRMLELKQINGANHTIPWTRPKVTSRDIAYPVLSRTNIVHTNTFIFRSDVFKKVGLFDPKYKNGEDGDMWMRVSELFKGTFSDHCGAIYRSEHGTDQLTKGDYDKINDCTIEIFKSALIRYQSAGATDNFREFYIHQNIAGLKYAKTSRSKYLSELLKLLLKYPIPFTLKSFDYFYEKLFVVFFR